MQLASALDQWDDALDDEREPVRFIPPDHQREWPPVSEWSRSHWESWLGQHDGWTPDRVAQYLDIDRYQYGVGFRRHDKEPITYFYLPNPAAVPFHRTKVPNVCYGGAVGGSKSHATRWDAYRHLLAIPEYNSILMRRTHVELKQNHTDKALVEAEKVNDFFQQTVLDLVPSAHEMRFPLTRGLMLFGHCQNLGDENKYLGHEYDEFRPDEMATFHRDQVMGVAGRLRSVKHGAYGRVRARLIGTTNPGGGNTLWIRDEYVTKTVPRHLNPKYNPDDYCFIPSTLYDNPWLMDADGSYTEYEKRLYAYHPVRRRQLLNGDWNAVTGQFFPEWNADVHVACLDIPAGCRIERWIDWGYSPNPGYCTWVACFPNGRLYAFAEWVFNGEGRKLHVAGDVADRIARMTQEEILPGTRGLLHRTIGDPSMWAKSGHTGESYAETFARHKVRMQQADNDRVQGWGRFRHWLKRHPEGGAWFMAHPDCAYLCRTIPTLIQDATNPDDVDTTGEDHAGDAIRYGFMARPTPTKYRYTPAPTMPSWIQQVLSNEHARAIGVRPFGKVH